MNKEDLKKIPNFTLQPTPMYLKVQGVFDLDTDLRKEVRSHLVFHRFPKIKQVLWRAEKLSETACRENFDVVLIQGPSFLMPPLVNALRRKGVRAVFPFHMHRCENVLKSDGTAEQKEFFENWGFIDAILE